MHDSDRDCYIMHAFKRLTFRSQHRHDVLELDAKYHSSYDDGGQRGLGDEGAGGHEDDEGEDDDEAREDSASRRLHAAGVVDGRPGEGAGGRVGLKKTGGKVAQSQRDHLLAGIDMFPAG